MPICPARLVRPPASANTAMEGVASAARQMTLKLVGVTFTTVQFVRTSARADWQSHQAQRISIHRQRLSAALADVVLASLIYNYGLFVSEVPGDVRMVTLDPMRCSPFLPWTDRICSPPARMTKRVFPFALRTRAMFLALPSPLSIRTSNGGVAPAAEAWWGEASNGEWTIVAPGNSVCKSVSGGAVAAFPATCARGLLWRKSTSTTSESFVFFN